MKRCASTLALVLGAALTCGAVVAQGRGGPSGRGGGHWSGYHGVAPGHWRAGQPGAWFRGGWVGPGVSFYVGPGWWGWPYPYPHPVAYPGYPYPVYVPADPPVYLEGPQTSTEAPAPANYWYYCPDPAGYYPYVQQCRQPWLTVVPPATASAPAPPAVAPSTPVPNTAAPGSPAPTDRSGP